MARNAPTAREMRKRGEKRNIYLAISVGGKTTKNGSGCRERSQKRAHRYLENITRVPAKGGKSRAIQRLVI